MIYPEALRVGDQEYEINTSYLYALACIACVNDPELTDAERAFGVIEILYKEPLPTDGPEAVRMAVKFLSLGKDPVEGDRPERAPDMDYEADMHYIRASFRSDYGVDLARSPDLHWWEFMELLQGLTDKCVLNRIRDLRNYDISTVKDAKTRSSIIQAQREVALPGRISQEDQDTLDDFYARLAIPEVQTLENSDSE